MPRKEKSAQEPEGSSGENRKYTGDLASLYKEMNTTRKIIRLPFRIASLGGTHSIIPSLQYGSKAQTGAS